jgi:hypothetical protein
MKHFSLLLKEAEDALDLLATVMTDTTQTETPEDTTLPKTFLDTVSEKYNLKEYKKIGNYQMTVYGYFKSFAKMDEFMGNNIPDEYEEVVGSDDLVYFTAEGPKQFVLIVCLESGTIYQYETDVNGDSIGDISTDIKALTDDNVAFVSKWMDAIKTELES